MNEQDRDNPPKPYGEIPSAPQRRPAAREKSVKPTVSTIILGVTVAVYVLQLAVKALTGVELVEFYGMKINEFIIAGEFWRLITPVLLHGSILHIMFNMYALYAIGRGLEQQFGNARFLLLYLVTAFTGNVLSFLITPNPSLGASTAIFGIVAAEGVFIFQNRELFGGNARAMLSNTFLIVFLNLAMGATSTGIDNWGHLGGLLGGIAFAWFAGPLLSLQPSVNGYRVVNERSVRRAVLVSIVIVVVASLLVLQKIMLAGG